MSTTESPTNRATTDEPQAIADRLHTFAEGTLAHLDRQQTLLDHRLATHAPGSFDPQLAQAGAALARARSTAIAELRKLEKHDRVMVKSPEQRFALVKEYLRSQATPAQCAEVAAMLVALARERSVLL